MPVYYPVAVDNSVFSEVAGERLRVEQTSSLDSADNDEPLGVVSDIVETESSVHSDHQSDQGTLVETEAPAVDDDSCLGTSHSPLVRLPPEAVDQVLLALRKLSGVRCEIAVRRLKQTSTSKQSGIAELIAGISEIDFLEYLGVLSRLLDKEVEAENASG